MLDKMEDTLKKMEDRLGLGGWKLPKLSGNMPLGSESQKAKVKS